MYKCVEINNIYIYIRVLNWKQALRRESIECHSLKYCSQRILKRAGLKSTNKKLFNYLSCKN